MLVYGSYEHVPILGAIDDLYRMPAMETESQKLAVEFTRQWCKITVTLNLEPNKLLSDENSCYFGVSMPCVIGQLRKEVH